VASRSDRRPQWQVLGERKAKIYFWVSGPERREFDVHCGYCSSSGCFVLCHVSLASGSPMLDLKLIPWMRLQGEVEK